MTELSFIIPAHNVEHYVRDCLLSISRAQNHSYEIVFVDDKSTDRTVQIAKNFSSENPRINFQFLSTSESTNHAQGGPAAARNLGAENACGQYVAFIDSDDWINVTAYRNLLDLIKRNECEFGWLRAISYDMMRGSFRSFNDEATYNNVLQNRDFFITNIKETPSLSNFEASNCNRIYRRDFFLNQVAPFPDGLLYEDLPTHFRSISSAKNIAITRTTGYFYRINRPNKRTDRNDDGRLDVLKILGIIASEQTPSTLPGDAGPLMISWLVDFTFWCIQSLPWKRRKEIVLELPSILQKFPTEWIDRVLSTTWGNDQKSYMLWLLLSGNVHGTQLLISSRFDSQTSLKFYRETNRFGHIKFALNKRVRNLIKFERK